MSSVDVFDLLILFSLTNLQKYYLMHLIFSSNLLKTIVKQQNNILKIRFCKLDNMEEGPVPPFATALDSIVHKPIA